MANKIGRVPVREQDPKVRATNFEEVCYGYNVDEAMLEATRCLHCKNPRCVGACPVGIKIPEFIEKVKDGDFAAAAAVIAEDSSLPAICGRVCPQETQCEGSCILGIKGESVAIGKLERFVADWTREQGKAPAAAIAPSNGKKVAIIGSGPSGLACAADLAKLGYDVTIFEALHRPGGVLEYGIPEFRLPKDKVVAAEIEAVKALGVKIELDVIIGRTVTIDSLMDEEGFHGMVTALLAKLVNDGNKYTQAVAIGPMIMMKFTTLTAKKLGLPIVVSLNTLMVDGTGMCGACRVTVAGKTRRRSITRTRKALNSRCLRTPSRSSRTRKAGSGPSSASRWSSASPTPAAAVPRFRSRVPSSRFPATPSSWPSARPRTR